MKALFPLHGVQIESFSGIVTKSLSESLCVRGVRNGEVNNETVDDSCEIRQLIM